MKVYTKKERAQMLCATYKNRLKGRANPFTMFFQFEEFVNRYYGDLCHYCGEMLTIENIGLDHKYPLSRGGSNNQDNLECICKRCNRRKGQLSEGEYQALLRFLADHPAMKDILLRRLSQAGFMFFRTKK